MGDVDREAVLRLFSDLEALRRALRLYPPAHPALEPARARLRERGAALSPPATVTQTVSFGGARLFWAGEEVPLPPATLAAHAARLLTDAGLSALRLTFPQAVDGLLTLADRLAELSETPGEADRSRLFAGPAPTGIELVPIDLSGVQLLDADDERVARGSRNLWTELAQRLARDGAFPIADLVNSGDLQPGSAATMAAATSNPETLFDHLFAQLAEIARSPAQGRRPFALTELRAFFTELLGLLDPERRRLAVVIGLRHLPLADSDDPWVAGELLVDAGEQMLVLGLELPAPVRRALHDIANPGAREPAVIPAALTTRARDLLARLPSVPRRSHDGAGSSPRTAAALTGAARSQRFAEAFAAGELRRHLVRILLEAITLWPDAPVAELAAIRLAEDFTQALEIADIDTAARLAPLLAASRSEGARRVVASTGVPAAVQAFRAVGKARHAKLTTTLIALGDAATPAIVEALADEENLAVRKRLLEIVAHQGSAAVPHLKPLLDDPRWYVARNAVFLLRRTAAGDLASDLKRRADGAHPKVLIEILKALVTAQDPEWFATLIRFVDDPDPERSMAAIEVAARTRNPDVAAELASRLRARTGSRLREAGTIALMRALGHLGDAVGRGPLRRVAELKQWRYTFSLADVRREAVAAIALIDAARVQPGAASGRSTEAAAPEGELVDPEDDV